MESDNLLAWSARRGLRSDAEAAAKRGGKALSSSASRSVVKVVPKSAVAKNANEEEFLQPNAQVLTTNLTYEQMSAKVEGPEHPNLKRRDERRARNHHMGCLLYTSPSPRDS